jgi:hypothetical protein
VSQVLNETKSVKYGSMMIDFEFADATQRGESVRTTGVVVFHPNTACPDTSNISFVQFVQLQNALSDGSTSSQPADEKLRPQATSKGIYLDQDRSELGRRVLAANREYQPDQPATGFASLIGGRTLHLYHSSGRHSRELLTTLLKTLDPTRTGTPSGEQYRAWQRCSGVNGFQLTRIFAWAQTMGLGAAPTNDEIEKAMATTISQHPALSDEQLKCEYGIDISEWQDVRKRLAGPVKDPFEGSINTNSVGHKRGTVGSPAALFDQPAHNDNLTYSFWAAPFDLERNSYLGLVRWGFRIEVNADGIAQVRQPWAKIGPWDPAFEPEAREAEERFYAYWMPQLTDWRTRFPYSVATVEAADIRRRVEALTQRLSQRPDGTFPNLIENRTRLAEIFRRHPADNPPQRELDKDELAMFDALWT